MTDARAKWAEVRATDVPVDLRYSPNLVDRFLGDPKRVGFMFARYAFAAKMLQDRKYIIDVGCGAGEGTLTFLQDTKAVISGVDFDEALIFYANTALQRAASEARSDTHRISFRNYDFLTDHNRALGADGIVCLDVIEHVEPEKSEEFIYALSEAMNDHGVAVIGTPNQFAAHLGSAHSQLGHINNFTPARLRADLKRHFSTVLLFGMNDSTLHTGHEQLWHYILAVAVKG